MHLFTRSTPIIADEKGNQVPDSIAVLERIEIGGLPQWLLMRGKNVNNPILLYLHGGPGVSSIFFARKYMSQLEDHFVVVNWDQRGAGLSYSKQIPRDSMNINQYVEDIIELTNLLSKRLNKEKVYLVGSSWGSLIGMLAIQKHPELFYSFTSLGQIGNLAESEPISYDYVMKKAIEANNEVAIKELKEIGNPPHSSKNVELQRKWLTNYGGTIRNNDQKGLTKLILNELWDSKEYKFIDLFTRFLPGKKLSHHLLWDEMITVNLFEQVNEVQVPVFFLIGRSDYLTTFEVAERYYNHLKAPYKEWIWFEESAHMVSIEEPAKFADIMINKVKNHDYSQNDRYLI